MLPKYAMPGVSGIHVPVTLQQADFPPASFSIFSFQPARKQTRPTQSGARTEEVGKESVTHCAPDLLPRKLSIRKPTAWMALRASAWQSGSQHLPIQLESSRKTSGLALQKYLQDLKTKITAKRWPPSHSTKQMRGLVAWGLGKGTL